MLNRPPLIDTELRGRYQGSRQLCSPKMNRKTLTQTKESLLTGEVRRIGSPFRRLFFSGNDILVCNIDILAALTRPTSTRRRHIEEGKTQQIAYNSLKCSFSCSCSYLLYVFYVIYIYSSLLHGDP